MKILSLLNSKLQKKFCRAHFLFITSDKVLRLKYLLPGNWIMMKSIQKNKAYGNTLWRPVVKLLIVDDCVDIINILSFSLKSSGCEIDVAFDGIEAMELLRHNSYNLVITDAEMPGLDGMELCKFIKSGFSTAYIIGVSGSTHGLNGLNDAGADICFSKPFHIDEIKKAIKNLLPDPVDPIRTNDSIRLSGHHFMTI
jgi:CheY-like chemotaxis protein